MMMIHACSYQYIMWRTSAYQYILVRGERHWYCNYAMGSDLKGICWFEGNGHIRTVSDEASKLSSWTLASHHQLGSSDVNHWQLSNCRYFWVGKYQFQCLCPVPTGSCHCGGATMCDFFYFTWARDQCGQASQFKPLAHFLFWNIKLEDVIPF